MTRQFHSRFECPNCRTIHTAETLFSRWIRENEELDAPEGFCILDADYWVHRFKTYGSREFQCIMLVEVKTNSKTLTDAQRDTLHLVNQIIRNRRTTPTKERKYEANGNGPLRVKSPKAMCIVNVRCYGAHLLRFSGLGPEDSERIIWDKTQIDQKTLTALLRFDLDPDTLKPIDFRSHHARRDDPMLFA